MPFKRGKFMHPGAVHSTGEKAAAPSGKPEIGGQNPSEAAESKHGEAQAPHGGGHTEEHITKTAPGSTQPHPATGVHAFHAHHVGGGKFHSFTHHDGGEVEHREHGNESEVNQAQQESFPPAQEGGDNPSEGGAGAGYADALSGIGGQEPY